MAFEATLKFPAGTEGSHCEIHFLLSYLKPIASFSFQIR